MIDVSLEGDASAFREVESFIEMIRVHATAHFVSLELDPETELSVVLTDDPSMRALNKKWNDRDTSTDVLSFPQFERGELPAGPVAIGDIVISLEYAERTNADDNHRARVEEEIGETIEEWPLESEVAFLLIHGLLHLVGYDHDTPESEQEMKAMEKQLWLSRSGS